jgi:hypothetical protein
MEFTQASIALLATAVFVLAGMVGYIYWQQLRLFQSMNSIVLVMSDVVHSVKSREVAVVEDVKALPDNVEENMVDTTDKLSVHDVNEEDDRVSVKDEEQKADSKVLTVTGPPSKEVDVDDLNGKSVKELKEILTQKGIPFGKRDGKGVLLSLLKATA